MNDWLEVLLALFFWNAAYGAGYSTGYRNGKGKR
jgi:hypothetical protein